MAANEKSDKAKDKGKPPTEDNKGKLEKDTDKEAIEKKTSSEEKPNDSDENNEKSTNEKSKIETTDSELQEKKVKRAFLDRFRRSKKKSDTDDGVEPSYKTEASPDGVAEELYRNLAEIKGNEYFVFRTKKKTVLIVVGVLVLLMWLVPLSKWAIETYVPQYAFWNPELVEQVKESRVEVAEEVVEEVVEDVFRIRIRNNSQIENAAQDMSDFLMENGFVYVEVVDDPESDYEGVFIVTKPGDDESRSKVEAVLTERYELASPSAELTEDSDFQVVILFGLTTPIEISTDSGEIGSENESTESASLN